MIKWKLQYTTSCSGDVSVMISQPLQQQQQHLSVSFRWCTHIVSRAEFLHGLALCQRWKLTCFFFFFLNQQRLQLTTQAGSVEANRFDKAVPINFLIDISCSLWLAGCNDLILKCKAEQVVKGVVWEVNEDGGSALLTKLLVLPFFIYFFSCYNAKSNT